MRYVVAFLCVFVAGCTAQQIREITDATVEAAKEAGAGVVDAVVSVATAPSPVTIAGLVAAVAAFAYVVVKKYVKK